MNRIPVRAALIAATLGALALFVSACGSSDAQAPAADATAMSFKLTDAGCDPHDAKAPAGPINFEIENDGSGSVTELEILDGETILGEKENLTEGLTGSFALTLEEGEYILRCNGGSEEDGTLTVTGKLEGGTSPEVEKAIASYRGYLEKNTAELTAETKPFIAAVVGGDVARAKSLYAAARIPYERIEPVAESFGDLDPRIDARANDVPAGEFGGFHRIEKALWEEGTAKGMAPVAEQLLADVEELAAKVRTVDLQAVQIANGANELLGEVSASKITGEEERYSHIDLVDFEANVEGAEAAFDAVEPLLGATDPELAQEIEAGFENVYAALEPYRRGDGFVSYTELTRADTRKLAQTIDVLAEKLSQVPAAIVSGEAA
ncbi:MAG TPA: iron uptake system protein EfeO [Solirubrobacterales bacterium]|jgi:iron uptake system component EfeO|nr:iron uptake system protein EfeO [Solirubrobacterales bacterium]